MGQQLGQDWAGIVHLYLARFGDSRTAAAGPRGLVARGLGACCHRNATVLWTLGAGLQDRRWKLKDLSLHQFGHSAPVKAGDTVCSGRRRGKHCARSVGCSLAGLTPPRCHTRFAVALVKGQLAGGHLPVSEAVVNFNFLCTIS